MYGSHRQGKIDRALATSTGLVITSHEFALLYADPGAITILTYPNHPAGRAGVQRRVDALLGLARGSALELVSAQFMSGRRTYTCRAMQLEPFGTGPAGGVVALLLERVHRTPVDYLLAAGALFHLSPRQRETVWGVMQGLTTKEIAAQMKVSPHTVKQFIRQSMEKLGVTTRAGLVGRVVSTDVTAGRHAMTTSGPFGRYPPV